MGNSSYMNCVLHYLLECGNFKTLLSPLKQRYIDLGLDNISSVLYNLLDRKKSSEKLLLKRLKDAVLVEDGKSVSSFVD